LAQVLLQVRAASGAGTGGSVCIVDVAGGVAPSSYAPVLL
jgi:hypothetical protein